MINKKNIDSFIKFSMNIIFLHVLPNFFFSFFYRYNNLVFINIITVIIKRHLTLYYRTFTVIFSNDFFL